MSSEEMTPVNASADAPTERDADMKALTKAFEMFTQTTASMEESYQRLEERARTLDAERNSILDSMPDAVIAVDADGLITTLNRAGVDALGYAADEIVGKSYTDFFAPQEPGSSSHQVTELRVKGGARILVDERRTPLEDRSGKRIGTLHVFQDLREIEALREEVRRKDRLAAIGQMAATVAHEIRNPLGGIRGFAALLERDIDESDPRHRLVQKIIAGTKSLDAVVNELLEYTRPVELERVAHNCRDLVDAAISYLDRTDGAVDIENEVDPAVSIAVDSLKIRQVLLNILLNAVQSIDGPGTITITSSGDETGVTVSIADSGGGIAEEDIDKVFSPFFTTKEKGTGLGLAIAAKTVESHGGTLEVTSSEGQGATFHVRLPRAE